MNERLQVIVDAERRIELIRGRVQVGGHPFTTRIVLEQLLAQASLADLRGFGGDGWQGAAQLAQSTPAVQVGTFDHRRHYSLLQRLSLPLFDVLRGSAFVTHSRDMAVRLGDNVLTPDVFVGCDAAIRDFYLEGPPLLAIEVVDAYNPTEELERLGLYEAGGAPEVWWFDPERRCVQQFVLQNGRYTVRTQTQGWLESVAVVGLATHLDDAWQPGWQPPLSVTYKGKLSTLSEPPVLGTVPLSRGEFTEAVREELLSVVLAVLGTYGDQPARGGYGANLPFAPHIGLTPQLVTFEAFISWTTEAKFEILKDRLIIGSERGTYELLGLLLMTFGLGEAFSLLSSEIKEALRGAN